MKIFHFRESGVCQPPELTTTTYASIDYYYHGMDNLSINYFYLWIKIIVFH